MTADRAEERRPVALRDAAPRVLVAYDGSPQAERALVHAATLVRHGGTVRVVNVVPAQGVGARLQTVGDDDRGRQVGVLARARRLLAAHGVHAETIATAGDPAAEILAAAADVGADVVVAGRGKRSHRLHGSVAVRLVRGASCDVLVVR
jgi:nucleotide-binding universal stress UspA family protein